MIVKILGSGCSNCQTLEERTRTALDELGVAAEVEHVTSPGDIAAYGVMRTPALVVDEDVVLSGRVPTVAQLRDLLPPA